MSSESGVSALEAFRNAYWSKHDREDFEKAQRLREDIEHCRARRKG